MLIEMSKLLNYLLHIFSNCFTLTFPLHVLFFSHYFSKVCLLSLQTMSVMLRFCGHDSEAF